MANKITEKYFNQPNLAEQAGEILAEISAKTKFRAEKEIFRGCIYDKNKVGSLIYKGSWRGQPAVLKIQGLKPEMEEADIIKAFAVQNKSKKIRTPQIYASARWQKAKGYGYLIMEYIDAPRIYNPPFASPAEQKEFCALYQEYRTKCLNKPFAEKDWVEASSLALTFRRVSHWAKIGESKGYLTSADLKRVEKFFVIAAKHLPSIKTEFMHGHFTYDDIFKISENEYVIMSNLFWCWRPEFYDTTFHLWAGIKSIIDPNITLSQVKRYLQTWLKEYKKLPAIARDHDFERKFNMAMLERCIGALLVDIQNQKYPRGQQQKLIAHLTGLFQGLFDYYAKKLA